MAVSLINIMVYALIIFSVLSALGILFADKLNSKMIFIFSVAFILIFITLTFTAQPSNYIALKLLLFSFYPLSLFAGFLYLEKNKTKHSKIILLSVLIATLLIFL